MASVDAVGQHFIKFPLAGNVNETAVEAKHSCVMASVGAVGQRFIKFPWAGNEHKSVVGLQHGLRGDDGCRCSRAALQQFFRVPRASTRLPLS